MTRRTGMPANTTLETKYLDVSHVGPPEDNVRELYAPLLSYFQSCQLVLDLGCGRGIVLEMLGTRGITAIGCDDEPAMAVECRRKGLECVETDALTFLRETTLPIDGICCGHLIEHLPPKAAMELISLCHRALRPGGTLVLVTPNPADLKVITHYFWLDLTHVRPYPGSCWRRCSGTPDSRSMPATTPSRTLFRARPASRSWSAG